MNGRHPSTLSMDLRGTFARCPRLRAHVSQAIPRSRLGHSTYILRSKPPTKLGPPGAVLETRRP